MNPLTVMLLMTAFKSVFLCSDVCTCKWKNGKQTVNCANQNLKSIPGNLNPEAQVLDFSGNKLTDLPAELFINVQMVNLQRIHLMNCKIKSIHDDTFKGLLNLVELDLSNNYIDMIPTETFKDIQSLMRLNLNFNPIHTLKPFSFNYLSYLNHLELSNCSLFDIEEGAFQGMHSLEYLHLDGNRLKTIPGTKTLPQSIKGIELQQNAWECDCHIQDLHAWLVSFNIPLSVDPVCKGPPRLSGRIIKSISATDLACLPDISPTTFYLELGEGKNVSLLCHVYAKPEATVSWWFQGQILQNNTLIAPGLHLIYFVEEGTENKRSELFIYNANVDDNGTFVCNAENAAGSTQSNFTIKIILKEDPIVIIVSFPLEYFLIVVGAAAALGILIIIVILVLIFRCHKSRRNEKKREKAKVDTQHQQNSGNKSEPTQENIEVSPELNTTSDSDDTVMYGVQLRERMLNSLSPVANQIRSPSSLRRYQLEQNPDLINGTESIKYRREGDGADQGICMPLENDFSVRGMRNVRCVLDSQGYPIDYGLPKILYRNRNNDFYRTLPTNRMKRHPAANPLNRYSRETEFLSRSIDSAYDYQSNVRHTADGYPARRPETAGNFDQENAAPSSLPCCSVEWPPYIPANFHPINPIADIFQTTVTKRCVSAQTDSETKEQQQNTAACKTGSGLLNARNEVVNEVLTESPDEGYEGEPSVV